MADDAVSWQDYKSPDERAAEQADASKKDNASPTWADYGKTLAIGGADVAQGVGSMLQASGDANQLPGEKPDTFTNALGAMGKWLREKTGEYSDETVESLSPAAKKRLESTLTSSEFWDHPVSALMLKSTRQVPQLATALVPAGLAVKAAQAGVIAAGMNGVLNAAQSVQGFYDIVDKASDQELRQSKFYNDLRDAGMSEDTARTRFRQKLSGNEPLVNFVIGSITGAVSPEAMLARSITGGTGVIGAAGRGIAGRAGLGLAEGAVGGGIEEGVQNYGTQIQQMQQNLKQSFDTGSLVDAVLEGGAIEGLMGGVAGASSRSHAAKTTDHTTASPKVPSTADTTATDNPAQVNQNPKGITTGIQSQPPGTRTGGEDYSKAQNGKKGKKSVTVTDKSQVEAPPNAATLEQAAAMQGESSPTVPRAEDIMANVVQSTRAQAAGQPTVPVQEQTAAPGAVAPPQVPAQVQPIQEAPPQPSGALPVDGGPSDIPVQPSAVAPGVEPNAPVAPQGVSPDVAEATSGATAPVTPRVLPDQTAASRQNAAAQLRVQDQNLKAAQAEPTAPKGSNYTLKEQAANKFRDEVHKTVVERNAPVKGETDEQTFARAKRMVEEATPELAKIANPEHKPTAKMLRASKLPTRLKGENHTGSTAVLAEAAALHKASTRGPKLKAEALTRFRANEAAARAGNVAEVLSSRRVEGEVNRAPEQTSAPVGGAVEAEDKLTASPEEEVISREDEDLTEGGKLAGEKRVDQAEERAKAAAEKVVQKVLAKKEIPLQVIPKEPSYQAVTSRVTPVKVEVKRSKRTFPKAEAAKAVSIARAAAKTEVGLTEAQKKSGNYVKGVADVSGVKVAIETARGEERTGKDQNGVEWRVKMPDHYGEIQGTRGADGDKVDAYIGTDPTSKHVFVIDQQDPDTGAFDEHKAMLHYADAQKALDAYEKAFSDGRGLERVASMRSMTLDEFKAWKNNRKATTAPTDAHPEVAEAPARVTLPEGKAIPTNLPTTKVDVFLGGEKTGQHEVNALKVAPLRSFLNSELIEPLNGPLKPYFNLIRRRILAATPNTKVVVLHPNEIGRIKGEQAAYGAAGYYDYVNDQVILNANELTRGSQELTHTLLHEAIHAATYGQMVSYRGPARFVREVMNEVAFLHPDATTEYGFTNEDEFLAEALTDAKFQNFLVNTPLSEGLAKKLDIKSWRGESVWGAIVQTIRKLLGLPAHVTTALDAALSITDRLASTPVHEDIRAGWDELKQRRFEEAPARLVDSVTQAAHELVTRAPKQEQMGKPWALKVMMTDQIAQMAENYFPNNNPVRRVADLMERTRTLAKRYLEGNGAILQRQAELQKKYNGPVWDQFVSMVHDETTAKVWADVPLTDAKNAHLGKDRLDTAWARAQHAELRKEYLALTATRPDLAKLRKDSIAFYRDTQNKMALKLIENRVLKALGIKDPALAQRVFDETTTASDEALLGKDVIEMIQKTSELAKIKGPYFPLMRRGDHVVSALHKVNKPANATELAPNEFEFAGKDARKRAVAYAQGNDLETDIKSKWVSKVTGLTHDANGVRISPNDADAEQRFVAKVQNRHVEFVDGAKAARELAYAMEQDPAFESVKGVQVKELERASSGELSSPQLLALMRSIQRRKGWENLSVGERKRVELAVKDLAIQHMGSTHIQSKRLPRTNVLGYSHDLLRNTGDYALSSSQYLARLEHAPALEDALTQMRSATDAEYGKNTSLGRSAIANEIEGRVLNPVFDENKGVHAWVKRALTISFLDKLFGPSHSIINMTQPGMVTMPVLSGRHGVAKSFSEMRRAYSDVGGLGILKKGIKETVANARPGRPPPRYIDDIIKRATHTKEEADALRYLTEVGSIDPDSGFELDQLIQTSQGVGGKIDAGLSYLEGIARQMPRAIEAMNRTVTGLAAFRLEFAKTGNYDKSVRYAQETVNNTQFLYSGTNRPAYMKHPLAKLFLQFKQFGQGMYHLMGMNIGKAIHNLNEGDRKEAIKTLVGIAGTHAAMAGALGLPTEPIKFLLIGLKYAGITSLGWDDVEDYARRQAAWMFGKTLGEAASRGLPRLMGIDISSRVGLDSLLTFGQPRSDKEADVKKWVFDTIAGAPAALITDWGKGLAKLWEGDISKAAELLIPMKVVSDSIRAYRQSTEGKHSETSGRQSMTPYTPAEAITRVMGFTPAREAETGQERSNFYGKQQDIKTQRQALMTGWITAKPNDKRDAWAAIQKYNQTHQAAEQIKMSELTAAAKRRETEKNKGSVVRGIPTNKRDRHLLDNSPYNTQ